MNLITRTEILERYSGDFQWWLRTLPIPHIRRMKRSIASDLACEAFASAKRKRKPINPLLTTLRTA